LQIDCGLIDRHYFFQHNTYKNSFMHKIIRIAFLLLAAATPHYASGAACQHIAERPAPEVMQDAMQNARDHGFLWRISKQGRTSYLYGTIHVAQFEWVFPGPSVTRALQESDTIAVELDFLDDEIKNRMGRRMAIMQSAKLPDALLKRMRQQAEALCVPYSAIARLTPEMQIASLTMMVGREAGLDAAYGIDAVLAGIGHRAKKHVVSLETPEMQLQLLLMQTPQETFLFVEEGLKELESGRALSMLKRTASIWANSDDAEMERYKDWCECLETETDRELMKRALDERNPALADNIDALHSAGKQVFAAVGSLHMFGATGLPELMQKRGYIVERVNFK
jgi:uncharacterized protein